MKEFKLHKHHFHVTLQVFPPFIAKKKKKKVRVFGFCLAELRPVLRHISIALIKCVFIAVFLSPGLPCPLHSLFRVMSSRAAAAAAAFPFDPRTNALPNIKERPVALGLKRELSTSYS